MPPIFYLAIGGRSTRADLQTALDAGQRHFLVPAGTLMAERLRCIPQDVRVVLDSGAWPIDNPHRLSLEDYAGEIVRWRQPDGSWGRLDWFAAYDHITDPAASQRDEQRLLALLADAGAADAPLVPVTHYPSGAALHVLLDLEIGYAGNRADLIAGTSSRPCYGVGGLVPALAPIRPQAVFDDADQWYDTLISELEQASAGDDADADAPSIDPELLRVHLFGIGRPAFTLRSPLVASFDSSGPIQQARFGWQKIAPSFEPCYGLSAEKLQKSRFARVAYWILKYQSSAGLPWSPSPMQPPWPTTPSRPHLCSICCSMTRPSQGDTHRSPKPEPPDDCVMRRSGGSDRRRKVKMMPNVYDEDDDRDLDDEIDDEEEAPRRTAKAHTQPKRESRESREAKANAEAQQRGQDAYANGEPRTANPYKEYSSTRSSWLYGWGMAWFAATGAKGMPVYSHMPSSFCTPAEANHIHRRASYRPGGHFNFESRDNAPALPWTIDQLPGTRWLNIHTGRETAIGPIGLDRWGQAVAPFAGNSFSSLPGVQYINTLGLWWSGRSVVEHWIRCDHWQPAQRLHWFSAELAHVRGSESDPERQKRYERDALTTQQQFADQHGLVLTTEQINAGRGQRTDGKPDQLSLF